MMGDATKAALITGALGIIGSIAAAFIGTHYGEQDAIIQVNLQVESEIVKNENSSINSVDDLIDEYNNLIAENVELKMQNNKSYQDYSILQQSYNELENEFTLFKNDIPNNYITKKEYSSLKISYEELEKENKSLEEENLNLKQSYDDLEKKYIDLINGKYVDNQNPDSDLTTVSIFDLDTFHGISSWYTSNDLKDTHDNVYTKAYYTRHSSKSENDINGKFVPTYLLDSKYSKCEGKIAWSKDDKNTDGRSWIDFYCDGVLKYSTDPINASDKPQSFEFSVENVETLKIVCNGHFSKYSVKVIYEYLNLVP